MMARITPTTPNTVARKLRPFATFAGLVMLHYLWQVCWTVPYITTHPNRKVLTTGSVCKVIAASLHSPRAPSAKPLEIGYALVPSERGKGYCSEAVKIMVDHLFLSKDVVRIQAHVDVRNAASQKVVEKAGFKREGVLRKVAFVRGEWQDFYSYSILREEWKEPKTLARTA